MLINVPVIVVRNYYGYWFFIFQFMAKKINYLDTFIFPDIPFQYYPVYSVSESGHVINLKSMMYPTPKSRKKFTRNKQLGKRSLQAKIFDAIIEIGYFNPLLVIKEFPIVIQNSRRLIGQKGSFYYLDYYFPTMKVCVELDSDLHKEDKDEIRDRYLDEVLGIKTFRMKGLDKAVVQRVKFPELASLLRSISPLQNPPVFAFSENIRLAKGL